MIGRLTSMSEVEAHVAMVLGEHAADHDVAAIARRTYCRVIDHNEAGAEILTSARYEQHVTDGEFWAEVQAHALS